MRVHNLEIVALPLHLEYRNWIEENPYHPHYSSHYRNRNRLWPHQSIGSKRLILLFRTCLMYSVHPASYSASVVSNRPCLSWKWTTSQLRDLIYFFLLSSLSSGLLLLCKGVCECSFIFSCPSFDLSCHTDSEFTTCFLMVLLSLIVFHGFSAIHLFLSWVRFLTTFQKLLRKYFQQCSVRHWWHICLIVCGFVRAPVSDRLTDRKS